jgi:NAD-dependent deacetylase
MTPKECAEHWMKAKKVGVLTGAGLSTAAGIPDFRGPKGLYVTRKYDPETVFEIQYFRRDPAPFYAFSKDFLGMIETIKPTFTHSFLAKMESENKLTGVITQNIDGLHTKAGSKTVIPVHGDYETAHCLKCGSAYSLSDYKSDVMDGKVPHCVKCGSVIKPDVVFFGEGVRGLEEAFSLAASCDFFLVLGSSLQVYPAAAVPYECQRDVLVVNHGEVSLGTNWHYADSDLDEYFKEVDVFMRKP